VASEVNGRRVAAPLAAGFEADDDFVGAGVAEAFASKAFEGARIVLDGVNRLFELPGDAFLLLDLHVEGEDVFAVALILLDERKVPKKHAQQPGNEQEEDHHTGEFVPNA
jgi:hypothetical protein